MCDTNYVSLDGVSRLLERRILDDDVRRAGIGTASMRCEGPKGGSGPVPHIQRADVEVLQQKLAEEVSP